MQPHHRAVVETLGDGVEPQGEDAHMHEWIGPFNTNAGRAARGQGKSVKGPSYTRLARRKPRPPLRKPGSSLPRHADRQPSAS